MKIYAIINVATNIVGLVQGFGDDAVVATSSDAYVIEVTEGQCQEGDVYHPESQVFTSPVEVNP